MEAKKYLEMIHDHHFFDLKKMEYKYSKEDVQEMIGVMKEMVFRNCRCPILLEKQSWFMQTAC